MRRVILESPYAGDVDGNLAYARRCVRDCLERGEAPIASHLLFTQDGILKDSVLAERELGIAAGLAWIPVAEAMVVYLDHGMSRGMNEAMKAAQRAGLPVELRCLETVEVACRSRVPRDGAQAERNAIMTFINWPAKAEEAERIGDWDEAKRCWYYAAQELNGNPHELRTYYGQREDAAAECRAMARKLRGTQS